jgi:hypothetical protein
MVSVERTVDGLSGWYFRASLSRRKMQLAEEPQALALRTEDVFMSNSISFTRFGEELYGTLIRRVTVSDAEMSPARRSEVILEVGERCRKLGISKDNLPSIGAQFVGLIKERNLEINNGKQVSGSQK